MIGNRPTLQSEPGPMAPLPRPYISILSHLADSGGVGSLDLYGRVTVGPTKHPLQGDAVTWLHLVSRGLVAGEDGKIVLTQTGRDRVADYQKGSVREASV